MTFHKRVLEWQAEHPTQTWIFWIVVWAIVFRVDFLAAQNLVTQGKTTYEEIERVVARPSS